MIAFNAQNWFWKADDGRLYGSAAAGPVKADDAGYADFTAAGGIATVWPRDSSGAQTDASMDETLAFYGLPIGAPSVAQLAAALVAAVGLACDSLTKQVVPDQVHQNAYVNAAAMVGPGAVVPTAEPAKSAFAAMASSFGAEPAAFAAMVVAIAAVSWQLQAAQMTATRAAGATKTAADLTAALTAFETALGGIVAALAAAGVTVTAPAAITVAGL